MITRLSEDAVALRTGEPQTALAARADALRHTGLFEDVVPTMGMITVIFDPARMTPDCAERALQTTKPAGTHAAQKTALTVPVTYDGEDLVATADRLGLGVKALIESHASVPYTVGFLGFTPGFAYLGDLPEALRGIERLATPRTRVPAGSIGLAGANCGIYALGGPGGWPLIGRTDAKLFEPHADNPFTLSAGMTVRFAPAP